MVFFTCNTCGESIKKAQVEKHYLGKCPGCEVLSCVDCGKDFWGDEYKTHTKCMTEDEKYSGKNYVPKTKDGTSKNEKKQEEWSERVQIAIETVTYNPQLKHLLQSIVIYPNIPRKQNKFENFLQSCLGMKNARLRTDAWNAINSVQVESPTETTSCSTTQDIDKTQPNGATIAEETPTKNRTQPDNEDGCTEQNKPKQKKKRKTGAEQDDNHKKDDDITQTTKKKKKKECPIGNEAQNGCLAENAGGRFKWQSVMYEVVERTENHTISEKKLWKKVLKKFREHQKTAGLPVDKEKMKSKFDKKLSQHSKLHRDDGCVSVS